MLNAIWLTLILISIIVGVIQGRLDQVVQAATQSASLAFQLALNLAGIMAFWLGIMAIAEEAKLIQKLAKLLSRPLRLLFPDIKNDEKAMGAIVMNIAANMLG